MSDPVPEEFARALTATVSRRGAFGSPLYFFLETGSTNDIAAALAENGAPQGTMSASSIWPPCARSISHWPASLPERVGLECLNEDDGIFWAPRDGATELGPATPSRGLTRALAHCAG